MWEIKSFDDYHDIEFYVEDYVEFNFDKKIKKIKGIELGCFPEKGYEGFCRYFGLFYDGTKKEVNKDIKKIIDKVTEQVILDQVFRFWSVSVFYSQEMLIDEIRRAMKLKR